MPTISGRRFTNADTVIGVGLAVALIAVFLPWYSASFNGLGVNTSSSVGALADWPGWLFFLATLAGLALFILRTFVPTFSIPELPRSDAILYTAVGIVAAVMALLWLVLHSSGASGTGYSVGPGFGLFIGLLAGVAVAVGGFLKRSEPQTAGSAFVAPRSGSASGGSSTPPPPPPL